MTQYVRKFVYVDENVDKSQHYSGWQLCDTPAFSPMIIPYGVIHDAMEHFNVGEGTIEEEMMAIGALYHIRVLGKWWDQFDPTYDVLKSVAMDVAKFLMKNQFIIDHCEKKYPSDLNYMVNSLKDYYIQTVDSRYRNEYCNDNPNILKAFDRAMDWIGLERVIVNP